MPLIQLPRRMLSVWWCSFHWAPFEGVISAGRQACELLTITTLESPLFHERMQKQLATHPEFGRSLTNAAVYNRLIEIWTRENNKAICCLLGDPEMENMKQAVFRG